MRLRFAGRKAAGRKAAGETRRVSSKFFVGWGWGSPVGCGGFSMGYDVDGTRDAKAG